MRGRQRAVPAADPLPAWASDYVSACVLVGVLALAGCSPPPPPPEPVRAVRTVIASEEGSAVVLEFAGEVRARTESRLGFRVGGKLLRRDAEVGMAVRAGQRLAQLDPQDLQLGQTAAQAAVSAAEADLAQAEADMRRYTELRDQGFISTAELERRDTTLKSARARVAQARAQAAAQGNQTGYAVLAADTAGVVTAVEAEPGQVLSVGQPVLRLAHEGPRDVVFAVPEDKLALVRALWRQEGALRVRPWGGATLLPATLREIAAATDPVTRTLQVKAGIDRASLTLGQTVTVLLQTPQGTPGIRLPMAALFESQGKSTVWLLDGATMKVRAQPVQVAGAEGNLVRVVDGLLPGQEVVTAGVHVLTSGQTVRRYEAEPASLAASAQPAASR